jgi:hypothetical protein
LLKLEKECYNNLISIQKLSKKNLKSSFLGLMLALLILSAGQVLAQSESSDFLIEFDTVSSGAIEYSSNDFIIQGGSVGIQNIGEAADFESQHYSAVDSSSCGNGQIDPGEVCDLSVFQTNCTDLGFSGGVLSCSADCLQISTSLCVSGASQGSEGSGGSANLPKEESKDPQNQTLTPTSRPVFFRNQPQVKTEPDELRSPETRPTEATQEPEGAKQAIDELQNNPSANQDLAATIISQADQDSQKERREEDQASLNITNQVKEFSIPNQSITQVNQLENVHSAAGSFDQSEQGAGILPFGFKNLLLIIALVLLIIVVALAYLAFWRPEKVILQLLAFNYPYRAQKPSPLTWDWQQVNTSSQTFSFNPSSAEQVWVQKSGYYQITYQLAISNPELEKLKSVVVVNEQRIIPQSYQQAIASEQVSFYLQLEAGDSLALKIISRSTKIIIKKAQLEIELID